MKASEIRKLIGKLVKFKSNRVGDLYPYFAVGTVKEVYRTECYIADDWHNCKDVVILDILPPASE